MQRGSCTVQHCAWLSLSLPLQVKQGRTLPVGRMGRSKGTEAAHPPRDGEHPGGKEEGVAQDQKELRGVCAACEMVWASRCGVCVVVCGLCGSSLCGDGAMSAKGGSLCTPVAHPLASVRSPARQLPLAGQAAGAWTLLWQPCRGCRRPGRPSRPGHGQRVDGCT